MVTDLFLQKFKDPSEYYLEPVTRFLASLQIHPHVFSGLSLFCGFLSFLFLFNNHVLFVSFGVLHLFFDIFDGKVARYKRQTSVLGYYIDHGGDRFIAFLWMSKFVAFFASYLWWALVLVVVNSLLYHLFRLEYAFFIRSLLLFFFSFTLFYFGFVFASTLVFLGLLFQIGFLVYNAFFR